MELTVEEQISIEENRVRTVLQGSAEGFSETQLANEYKNLFLKVP